MEDRQVLLRNIRLACAQELVRLLEVRRATDPLPRRELSRRVGYGVTAADSWVAGTGWPWEAEPLLCQVLGVRPDHFLLLRSQMLGIPVPRFPRVEALQSSADDLADATLVVVQSHKRLASALERQLSVIRSHVAQLGALPAVPERAGGVAAVRIHTSSGAADQETLPGDEENGSNGETQH